MKLQYHIKHLYGCLYAVSSSFEFNGARKEIITKIQCKATELPDIVKRAGMGLGNAIFCARRRDADLPNNNRYVWDCDTSDLQTTFATENKNLLKNKQPQKNDKQKRVLEVKKVNNVWTIVKHETELLTWEEACNLLRERIDDVQKN